MCVLVSPTETEAGEKAAKEEAAVVENATPDYAAGLVSTQVYTLHVSHCLSLSFPSSLPLSLSFTEAHSHMPFVCCRNWGR